MQLAMAAGDIACASKLPTPTSCWQKATSDILVAADADGVLAAGDLQYEKGTLDAFLKSFDPTVGAGEGLDLSRDGNHEYNTAGAAGYFGYFGEAAGDPAKGYYSFDLGSWHVISLNSNCRFVSCAAGSEQEVWLREDLASNPRRLHARLLAHADVVVDQTPGKRDDFGIDGGALRSWGRPATCRARPQLRALRSTGSVGAG